IFNSLQLSVAYLLIFVFFYLKMLPNTIFFDMKDIKSDAKDKLKTVPVILGNIKTLKLMYLLNIAAFIPLLIGVWFKIFPLYAVLLVIFLLYSFYYLNMSFKLPDKEIKHRFFILADIEFILWPLILFTGNYIFF
ncbi:MAG: UbiA family prenyltransferase, partial [Methanobacterium sp.]|nr:UbiA family prenyltransferase [Methanobacterium sp.]